MRAARAAVEELVGAAAGSVALVDNATTAGSTVAQALAFRWHVGEWHKGDKVLLCTLTYDSVENAVAHYCKAAGAEIDSVQLPVPVSSKDEVVNAYAKYFAAPAAAPATRPTPRVRAAVYACPSSTSVL